MTKGIKESIEKGTETIAEVDSTLTETILTIVFNAMYYMVLIPMTAVLVAIVAIWFVIYLTVGTPTVAIVNICMAILGAEIRNDIRLSAIKKLELRIEKLKNKMEADKC